MKACQMGSVNMAAFLLENGADSFAIHRDLALRAGHFLYYDGGDLFGRYISHRPRKGNDLCLE
jgi:hypothetical protein